MAWPLPALSRLRTLEAVCRSGSFSDAAHELLLTQPAVSTQIRQLEEEAGVLLVERVGKTARATPAGARLIACAARIFQDLDGTLQELAALAGEVTGRLVIGSGATATTYLLPAIVAELERAHPKLEMVIVNGNTPDLVQQLLEAVLDIAILTAPLAEARLSQEPFTIDRLVCIVSGESEPELECVRPHDLAGRRLVLYERGGTIRNIVDAWLKGTDLAAPRILEIGTAEAQKSFVRAGFGLSIISEMAVTQEVRQGSLRALPLAPELSRQLVTVWRRDRAANPAIAAARHTLSDFALRGG